MIPGAPGAPGACFKGNKWVNSPGAPGDQETPGTPGIIPGVPGAPGACFQGKSDFLHDLLEIHILPLKQAPETPRAPGIISGVPGAPGDQETPGTPGIIPGVPRSFVISWNSLTINPFINIETCSWSSWYHTRSAQEFRDLLELLDY